MHSFFFLSNFAGAVISFCSEGAVWALNKRFLPFYNLHPHSHARAESTLHLFPSLPPPIIL